MKISSRWKRRLYSFLSAIAACVAIVTGIHLWLESIRNQCGYGETIIAENSSGDKVDATGEVCGGFGAMYVISFKLIKHDNPKPHEFFLYVPAALSDKISEQSIKSQIIWQNDHSLLIQVSQISDIIKKSMKVEDVDVHYEIGKVDFDQSQENK